MGVQADRRPPGGLDGLYGVQLAGRSPYSDDEAIKTSIMDSSAMEQQGGVGMTRSLKIKQLWRQRPPCLKPIHCSLSCDKNVAETVANVVTSLPFIFLGLQTPRQFCRKTLNTTLYANSLIGVGVASSLYHTSRGEIRKYMRWADYTMIATTTLCLTRALRDEHPRLLMAASTLLLPFQPLMVTALHTGMMEASFICETSIHRARAQDGT
ncbi:hypothetical protein VPH35_101170 [Triticum aestivum]